VAYTDRREENSVMETSSAPTAVVGRHGSRPWRSAGYWAATAAVAAELGLGGIWDIARLPFVRDLVTHLGYPSYFLVLLGTWKPPHPSLRRAMMRGRAAMDRTAGLVVRNLLFTVVVPGLGGAWVPWWILTRHGRAAAPVAWEAAGVIVAGAALYAWCVWNFATVGRGTPGPWDAPSRFVATGPYRWVRNPIYIAALVIVLGEAWLFVSLPLLVYAGAMAVFFHLFVAGYEERTLRRRFGGSYLEYRRAVGRWIPRPPPRG
jgi:protein-S-isoprenylcysteine O-methyltransferase Ste14